MFFVILIEISFEIDFVTIILFPYKVLDFVLEIWKFLFVLDQVPSFNFLEFDKSISVSNKGILFTFFPHLDVSLDSVKSKSFFLICDLAFQAHRIKAEDILSLHSPKWS